MKSDKRLLNVTSRPIKNLELIYNQFALTSKSLVKDDLLSEKLLIYYKQQSLKTEV